MFCLNVIAFIDQFVIADVTNTNLAPYVEYQKHKHGHSCLKKVRGQSVCRFGIPYPPMRQTEILKPLPEETQIFSLHHENFKKIRINQMICLAISAYLKKASVTRTTYMILGLD